MTDYIMEQINDVKELHFLTDAYKEGLIKVNISKLSRGLNTTRKTVHRYLNGDIPSESRKRDKYLGSYKNIILQLLEDNTRKFDYIDHLYSYMVKEHGIESCRSTFNRYIRMDKLITQQTGSSYLQ